MEKPKGRRGGCRGGDHRDGAERVMVWVRAALELTQSQAGGIEAPGGLRPPGRAERCEARPGEGACVWGGVVRKALTGGHCFHFTSSAAK